MIQLSAEVDGVQYIAVPQVGCEGCVANSGNRRNLFCSQMPDCGPTVGNKATSLIWVRRTPENIARHIAWVLEAS